MPYKIVDRHPKIIHNVYLCLDEIFYNIYHGHTETASILFTCRMIQSSHRTSINQMDSTQRTFSYDSIRTRLISCEGELATLANLAFVTISVWLFPKVWIFQITSTTAWILIAIQYYISRKLHRWHLEDLR